MGTEKNANDEKKDFMRIFEKTRDVRGEIIELSLWVEELTGNAISRVFFPNDFSYSDLLSSIVIKELTFRKKREILKDLLKNWYTDIYEKHPDLFGNLDKIINMRNDLAHLVMDRSILLDESAAKDTIRFFKYKNGKKTIKSFSDMDVIKHKANCIHTFSELMDLIVEVEKHL